MTKVSAVLCHDGPMSYGAPDVLQVWRSRHPLPATFIPLPLRLYLMHFLRP